MTSIRTVIVVAIKKGWKMYQLDFNNAFLHGNLDEEIHIRIPQGMVAPGSNIVCKLNKSLYGLKQAFRQWYSKLSDSLVSMGYEIFKNDYSLFLKSVGTSFTDVAVYTDDILLSENDDKEIASLILFLDTKFKIKDLGLFH